MNGRFLQYLRIKNLSQNKLSELTCVSVSTISRFCRGGAIASDNLLRLLQACDDLSLEWLFFGSGTMVRDRSRANINIGSLGGVDVASGEAILVKNSNGVHVDGTTDKGILAALAEKERIIVEKDRIIHERDVTIGDLNRLLLEAQKR